MDMADSHAGDITAQDLDDNHMASDARSLVIRNMPNAITCVTIACGFVLMVSATVPGISPQVCVIATALGLVADILDGTVARRLQIKSKFGATFDQLADLTCFGIGPAIFFTRQRQLALDGSESLVSVLLTASAGYAYMACSVYRIARELIVHDGARPLYFVGIPTNLACCVAVPMSASVPDHVLLPWTVLLLSALMVSNLHIPKGLGVFQVTNEEVTAACGPCATRKPACD
mmetsp:Transcript_106868/g.212209  ORF Transcript_106868/g.212209 Transcript_106868/m.212209 type:complete len:232 (-) Transcript_106868:97-792(-)